MFQAPLRSAATREVLQLMTFLLRLELLQNFFTKCLQNAAAYTGAWPAAVRQRVTCPVQADGRAQAWVNHAECCVGSLRGTRGAERVHF